MHTVRQIPSQQHMPITMDHESMAIGPTLHSCVPATSTLTSIATLSRIEKVNIDEKLQLKIYGNVKNNLNSNQNVFWKIKCLWCDALFSCTHATGMFSCVLQVKGTSVQACKGKISPDVHKCYILLFQKGNSKADSRKWALNVLESVANIQQSV